MSRIGKKSITIPEGVSITVGKDNVITVKGKQGELKQAIKMVMYILYALPTRSVTVPCMVCTAP